MRNRLLARSHDCPDWRESTQRAVPRSRLARSSGVVKTNAIGRVDANEAGLAKIGGSLSSRIVSVLCSEKNAAACLSHRRSELFVEACKGESPPQRKLEIGGVVHRETERLADGEGLRPRHL
jgi:hypothetical protein